MSSAARTVSRELQNLVMGVGKRNGKRRATELTKQVTADVLGQDAARVGKRARQLSRAKVQPKGEAANAPIKLASPLAEADMMDGGARFAANRTNGDRREAIVEAILTALFPKEKGYTVKAEQYLRDRHGRIAHDGDTGQSRRIDFAIFRGGRITKLLEVTSEKVSKAFQLAKEVRMRRHGGRYLLHPTTGERVRIPAEVKTSVIRLP